MYTCARAYALIRVSNCLSLSAFCVLASACIYIQMITHVYVNVFMSAGRCECKEVLKKLVFLSFGPLRFDVGLRGLFRWLVVLRPSPRTSV